MEARIQSGRMIWERSDRSVNLSCLILLLTTAPCGRVATRAGKAIQFLNKILLALGCVFCGILL